MDEEDAILVELRLARLRSGLTQQEVADSIGTVQSQISEWETGAINPSLRSLARWAAVLGQQVRLIPSDSSDTGEAGPACGSAGPVRSEA